MSETRKFDFPTEVISLPSEGKCYPADNPLSSGQIEIKYMTAKEEEILTSQNLIKKGVVLDKLFEAIIVDKQINSDDIIIGDKNAIMLATRILGYGADYGVEIEDSVGNKHKITVDLSQVKMKDIDISVLNPENTYTFVTPIGKNELTFKLLTHGDERLIDTDVKATKKISVDGTSSELTTRYRYMIKSVDGKSDMKTVVDFINNRFLTRDTKAFREYVRSIQPDMDMEFEFLDPETQEVEVKPIPMGVGFFWPS
jgi:hypothetical protein